MGVRGSGGQGVKGSGGPGATFGNWWEQVCRETLSGAKVEPMWGLTLTLDPDPDPALTSDLDPLTPSP